MTNFEKLEKIEAAIDELRAASMLVKAQRAETVVIQSVGLIRSIINENEDLKAQVRALKAQQKKMAEAQSDLIQTVDNWDKNYFGANGG